jgi:hypothetical protein
MLITEEGIVIYKMEGGYFSVDSSLGFSIISGKNGKLYLAMGCVGMPDNMARICKPTFQNCWKEIFKKENLTLREVAQAFRRENLCPAKN